METEGSSYIFSVTTDGSPTLAFGAGERMHNPAGAFAETEFIYGRAADYVLREGLEPRFVVVGLGLGYIELMLAARLADEDLFIETFERDDFLKTKFLNWLRGDIFHDTDEFYEAFQIVLKMTAQKYNVSEVALKERLFKLWRNGSWILKGELSVASLPASVQPNSGILFDAFSHKSSPELWSEKFLRRFLQIYGDRCCVFTTYAATGVLKRTLKQNGFKLCKSSGAGGKRESTFAVKTATA